MTFFIKKINRRSLIEAYLKFIGPWIIAIVDEWKAEAQVQPAKRTPQKTSRTKSSNTQRTENKTTDVVIHQHSRKLLKMDILMSETCWAHKWNKIASDIKLVFHSSTIATIISGKYFQIRVCQENCQYFGRWKFSLSHENDPDDLRH